MKSKKLFAVFAVIIFTFFYFLLSSFFAIGAAMPAISELLSEVSMNPAILLSPEYIGMTVTIIILLVVWLFTLIKFFGSIEDYFGRKFEEGKELSNINNEMRYLEIFIQTAEKEFMKRRISQETFNQIQVLTGKKMVELKSRKKKMNKEKNDSESNQ